MKYIFTIILILIIPVAISANNLVDSDLDGVPDQDEANIYHTDISKSDTDGDGYSDWLELNTGFSPLNPKPARLEDNDFDSDGLSDRMELNFHTDISNPDTDGDGVSDGDEIFSGNDPRDKTEGARLKGKRIQIDLEEINQIAEGYDSSQYESKGFTPAVLIQDFPIRGKAVYLLIRRRRWRNKKDKNEIIQNDYSIVAEGSKITKELSDFLKGTSRYT